MTTATADKIVFEQLLAQAAGIRMRAKNPVVGTRAGLIEQELAARLSQCAEASRHQPELHLENQVPDEEMPAAVNFAKQPTEGAKP